MKNQYISIEGLEGAGKSTATKAINDFLMENGILEKDITSTREPGGTPIAEMCRRIAKEGHPDEEMCDDTEVMLMFSARSQLLNNVVVPSLKKGKTVVSDRCYLSTIAYQRKEPELVNFLLSRVPVKPDLIILLDVTPEIGMERARGRGALDRIERKNIEFFYEAKTKYIEYAENNKDRVIVINADKDIQSVYDNVYQALKDFYK